MEHNLAGWAESAQASDRWRERDRVQGREAGDALAKWTAQVPWQFHFTLTFDPKKAFPANSELADREAFWWCTQSGRILRAPIGWLYAVERGPSGGAWHAHALVVGLPTTIGKAPIAMWQQRNGHIDVGRVTDPTRAASYVTKAVAVHQAFCLSDTLARYLHPSPSPSLRAGERAPRVQA